MRFDFNNISFAYGEFYALKNLSFSCKSGEIVGLVGENGAGKSSTIKNIVRYLKPNSGEILINGRNVTDFKDNYPVSYIPDAPVFYDELSLYEHLLFLKTMYPNNPVTVEELLDQLELRPYLNNLPFSLSKGTRQKLMIAIALLREYDILIADEPFSGLDPKQIVLLKKTFLKQKEQPDLDCCYSVSACGVAFSQYICFGFNEFQYRPLNGFHTCYYTHYGCFYIHISSDIRTDS